MGGFVIIFSVILSVLKACGLLNMIIDLFFPFFKLFGLDRNYANAIVSGFIELTNGLSLISSIPAKYISVSIIITAFLLGFGGFSVLLQVLSITSKSDISIKSYILGKFLHGIISSVLTYIFIHIFPIFNLDIVPIFAQNVNNVFVNSMHFGFIGFFLIFLIISLYFRKKSHMSTN